MKKISATLLTVCLVATYAFSQRTITGSVVDELGDLEDAIEFAAEIANLDPETYGRKTIGIELTPTEQLIVDLFGTVRRFGLDLSGLRSRPSALETVAGKIEKVVAPLLKYDDPKGLYAHCLCEFD